MKLRIVLPSIFCLLSLVLLTGCGREKEPTIQRSAPSAPASTGQVATPVPSQPITEPASKKEKPAEDPANKKVTPSPKDLGEKQAAPKATDSKAAKAASDKPVVKEPKQFDPALVKEISELLKSFAGINFSITELAMDMDKVCDSMTPSLQKLKELCKANKLKLVLEYQPGFEAEKAKFLVKEEKPWRWLFMIETGKTTGDCIQLDMTGKDAVLSVTQEGRRRFPETAVIPIGMLMWSVADEDGNKVGTSFVSPFIAPGYITASMAFPGGDAPQFLHRIFDIELIANAGQLKFLPGMKLFLEPLGRSAIEVPLFDYYWKKREEQEKKRGAAFDSVARPSPIKDAIGMVVYTEIVDHIFAQAKITEQNDTGYQFYIETPGHKKMIIFIAKPR